MAIEFFSQDSTGGDQLPNSKPAYGSRTAELVERAVQMQQEDARSAQTIGFVSRIFCQVALPHRDPGQIQSWRRTNGSVTLRLTPGCIIRDGQQIDAYPFGVIPRYLLAWMTTEISRGGSAVHDDGLTLDLGGSMNAFLRQIGFKTGGGGPRGNGTRLRDQITRIATSSITITDTRETYNGAWNFQAENFAFVRNINLWWSSRPSDDESLWPNTIRITEAWRDSIQTSAVPLDTRGLAIIQQAKAGPMALDLYYWLAHRLFSVTKTTLIPWVLLSRQFGSQYAELHKFKAAIIKQLRIVSIAYPQARINLNDDGLILKPSPTPVPR